MARRDTATNPDTSPDAVPDQETAAPQAQAPTPTRPLTHPLAQRPIPDVVAWPDRKDPDRKDPDGEDAADIGATGATGATNVAGSAEAASDGDHLAVRDASGRGRRLAVFARRHAVFLMIAFAGAIGRVLVVTTYRPALIYMGDSAFYAEQAWVDLHPGGWRPSGYPMFLRLIDGHTHLTRLVVTQHLMTFAVAVGLYAVALRALQHIHNPSGALKGCGFPSPRACAGAGRRRWLAAVVAAPAMLSPWVLDLGQFLLADSLFASMVAAAVVLVASPGRPTMRAVAAAGALLGASVVVRTAGFGPLAVVAVVLAVAAWRTRTRLKACATVGVFGLAAVVPLFGYATWSAVDGGRFAVSAHSGFFRYGRVAPFADCSVLPRPDLRTLCDLRPVAERPQPDVYLWDDAAALRQGNDDVPPDREELAGEFADVVVRAQPWMMISTTGTYLVGYFSPVPHENSKTSRAATWELPDAYTNVLPKTDPHHFDGYYVVTEMNVDAASVLAGYSKGAYAPMPLVGAGLLAGLVAALAALIRRSPAPPRLFWLAAGSGMSVLTIGAMTAGFDYRYLASVIGLLGAAAVAGFASLVDIIRNDVVIRGDVIRGGERNGGL